MNERPAMFADADDVRTLMGLVVGAASTCWENLDAAGVFQEHYALIIMEAALVRLDELTACDKRDTRQTGVT